MAMDGPNFLESLPPELLNLILEELLRSPTETCRTSIRPRLQWPLQYGYNPHIHPQILRINKNIYSFSKEVLHHSNQWIVFDIDCAHLLLAWAREGFAMLVVDPESAQALPAGLMHVRIKLYTRESSYARKLCSYWPASTPKRQTILVLADHLHLFLERIRIMELANGIRVVEGDAFQTFDGQEETSIKGRHGLSVCVHVDSAYRGHVTTQCLEHFRMLHGPLNELSIIGAPNEQLAQSIETSISLPRNSKDSTISEVILHAVGLIKHAAFSINKQHFKAGEELHKQALHLINHASTHDATPWAGWINPFDADELHFQLLVLFIPHLNLLLVNTMSNTRVFFATAEEAISGHANLNQILLRPDFQLQPQLVAYVGLLIGLHCMFCSPIGDFNRNRYDTDVIRSGMELIEGTRSHIAHMPRSDTVFFRVALKMSQMLRLLDTEPDFSSANQVVNCFKTWFEAHLKLIKLRVHESHIPQNLRDRSILSKMTNMSLMSTEEKARYIIVDTLRVDDREEGDYYLL